MLAAGTTILVVDDETAVLDQVGRMLRRRGYTVVCYSNPAEALEWCRARPSEAQLLLTDVVMPGLTGLELAAEVRTLRPDIPVLLMSGYPDRVPRGVLGSFAPLLQKPFTMARMLEAVARLLAERTP